MEVMPIPNWPALMLDDSILVVADLHIGLERELREAGFFLPSRTESMTDDLISILEEKNPKRLIILGDLKHTIPGTSRQEMDEVPLLIQAILDHVDQIEVLPGNHDGGIHKALTGDIRIGTSRGIRIDDIGLFHGHAWPSKDVMKSKVAVMAHNHPVIKFVDKLGMKTTKRCWMRTNFRRKSDRYERMPKELIVMPTFSEFCGGTPINDPKSKLLGPILSDKFLILKKSKVHLLDGTYLGVLSDLML